MLFYCFIQRFIHTLHNKCTLLTVRFPDISEFPVVGTHCYCKHI